MLNSFSRKREENHLVKLFLHLRGCVFWVSTIHALDTTASYHFLLNRTLTRWPFSKGPSSESMLPRLTYCSLSHQWSLVFHFISTAFFFFWLRHTLGVSYSDFCLSEWESEWVSITVESEPTTNSVDFDPIYIFLFYYVFEPRRFFLGMSTWSDENWIFNLPCALKALEWFETASTVEGHAYFLVNSICLLE